MKKWLLNNPDRPKHFAVGFMFGFLTYFMWIFLIIGSFLFIGKEFFDMLKPKPTGFCWKDVAADYAGFIIGYFAAHLLII